MAKAIKSCKSSRPRLTAGVMSAHELAMTHARVPICRGLLNRKHRALPRKATIRLLLIAADYDLMAMRAAAL